ncbi:MAG: hypothetical protein H8D47_05110 [Planctomycetes bacterium]|nr:hypothetical protein [Planctomycetota bacterium]MBL7106715.1 hypothetical protein [Phycisphaerae bacterium]
MYKEKSKALEAFSLDKDVADLVFENIPEDSPLMVIVAGDNDIYASDDEKLAAVGVDKNLLLSMCAHIDDGAEPVVVEDRNCTIIGSQIRTDNVSCGYVMVLVDKISSNSDFTVLTLIEAILQQVNLIVSLLEKNALLRCGQGLENFDSLGINLLVGSLN